MDTYPERRRRESEERWYATVHECSRNQARKALARERRHREWRERTGITAPGMEGDVVPMLEAPAPDRDDLMERVRYGV